VHTLGVAASVAHTHDLSRRQQAIGPLEAWTVLEGGSLVVVEHARGPESSMLIACSLPGASRTDVLLAAELRAAARRARGESLKVIAFDLGLSPCVVSKRVGCAMRKLRLESLAELVALFGGWPASVTASRLVGGRAEGLALTYRAPAWPLPPCLTAAERGVVQGLVEGKPYAAIARERGCSPNTVAAQVASVYRKMNVGSRLDLFVALQRSARTPT
jgi:DNA-binding NarL/FixJ family response regulator